MKPAAFRLTSTVLLLALIVGTLVAVSGVAFEVVRRQNEATQEAVARVELSLDKAARLAERAHDVSQRTLRLEARRLRFSILIETCTVARLQGRTLPNCRRVNAEARELVTLIQEFRQRLARQTASSDGGGTSTVTATTTRTMTTQPPQGCPKPNPNNPNCDG